MFELPHYLSAPVVMPIIFWLWKVGVMIFLGILALGLAIVVLKTLLILLSPAIFAGLLIFGVVTAPITLMFRCLGYRCPYFFVAVARFVAPGEFMEAAPAQDTGHYRSASGATYHNHYHYSGNGPDNNDTETSQKAETSDPWTILGVSRLDPLDRIKAAYRKKMTENHPDKVASLDPELQAFATKRSILIKEAYDSIMSKAA